MADRVANRRDRSFAGHGDEQVPLTVVIEERRRLPPVDVQTVPDGGLAIVVTYFGVQTIGHQKLDVFPEFAPVSVEIQTACLGLSPSEVEQLTTVPLEAALQGVPGVNDMLYVHTV